MDGQPVQLAIRVAQSIMKLEDPKLVIDGRWGRKSSMAYARSRLRNTVDAAVATIVPGADPESFGEESRVRSLTEEVRKAIADAATQFDEDEEAMLRKAEIESNFDPSAVNGQYAGLYQMSADAWKDATLFAAQKGIRLPNYSSGKFSSKWNALAAAAYRGVLRKQLRSAGYSGTIDDAVLYLAHQQGAAGFAKLYSVAAGDDELIGREVVTYSQRMAKNPPQDGGGETTDPYEFVTRWLQVAYEKTGSSA